MSPDGYQATEVDVVRKRESHALTKGLVAGLKQK